MSQYRVLVRQQPADTEAKIFHALAISASALPTDKTFANQLKAARILEPLWAEQLNHPGLAHYIIHTYDYPPLAEKARAAPLQAPRRRPPAASRSPLFPHAGHWSGARGQKPRRSSRKRQAIRIRRR